MKNLKKKTRLVLRVCLLVLLANICTVSYSDGRLYAGVSSSLEQKILDQKVSLNFKNKPIKDVLEEIIGEVQDEFDEEEEVDIKEIAEDTYIANAMMRIDELVEFFNLNESLLEEDDVETIAGLVVKLLGRIADVGDTVSHNGLTFTVIEIDGARVTKLQVYKDPVEELLNTSEEI